MSTRRDPANAARDLLGGQAVNASLLTNTDHSVRALRDRSDVLTELRCACGGLLVLVLRLREGDLLLCGITDRSSDHAAQLLWLDEALHVPATRCHCDSTAQGPGRGAGNRHVADIRADVAAARASGKRTVRLLHPPPDLAVNLGRAGPKRVGTPM